MVRRRNPDVICIPIVETYEEKAPRTLWPVNWEEKYGKENVRYDYYPALDENGNEITKEDIYITKERVRFRYRKRQNTYKGKKLFETYSDIKRKEEEENERKEIESSNIL